DVEDEWARSLVTAWDRWLLAPTQVGDELGAALLRAAPGQVVVADSTTINLYKAVAAASALRPGRTRVVLEADGFPTDRYIVDHLAPDVTRVPLMEIASAIDDTVAVIVASAVDFRTAEFADVSTITQA